jgi:hypothetical protein
MTEYFLQFLIKSYTFIQFLYYVTFSWLIKLILCNYIFILRSSYSKPEKDAGQIGICKFISDNKLTSSTKPIAITDTFNHACIATVLEYHQCWDELKKFCFLLGDCESATKLDKELCTRNPFPLKPETLSMYDRFKTGAANIPLNKFNFTKSTTDTLGNIIFCSNDWYAPGPIYKFCSSLHLLHELYDNLRGSYLPKCLG